MKYEFELQIEIYIYIIYFIAKVIYYNAKATKYFVTIFREWDVRGNKTIAHFIKIFNREHKMFNVISITHGFHMNKRNSKQIVNLKDNKYSYNM